MSQIKRVIDAVVEWLTDNARWLGSIGAIAAVASIVIPFIPDEYNKRIAPAESDISNTVVAAGDISIRGNNSEPILVGSNITVSGYSQDEYEKGLRARAREIKETLKEIYEMQLDRAEERTKSAVEKRTQLELELVEVQASLSNLEASYERTSETLREAEDAIEEFRGQLPAARLEAARATLLEGGPEEGYIALANLVEEGSQPLADAAFEAARLAESAIRYNDALRLIRKAVVLDEDNEEYLLENGLLLLKVGRYDDAEGPLSQALESSLQEHGESDSFTARSLGGMASLYRLQGKYNKAEKSAIRALEIRRQDQGDAHPDTVSATSSLAEIFLLQGKYNEAEPLLEHALDFNLAALTKHHPDTLASMTGLALLYERQGRYGEAEPLYLQALNLRREVLGKRHPDTIVSLSNLAGLYLRLGRYGSAEPLYEQALSLRLEVLGERHPQTIASLNDLAELYVHQKRYSEAEPLYEQALFLRREVLGERHPQAISSLNDLAELYVHQKRYSEAEPLYRQALFLRREVLGERHPQAISSLNDLAELHGHQRRYSEAETLGEVALKLRQNVLGESHPSTLSSIYNLARIYTKQGRYAEAEPLLRQVLALRREVLGVMHPDTHASGLALAALLPALDKATEAAQTLRRLEPSLLDRLHAELYSTEPIEVRRTLVASQKAFRDIALSLALAFPDDVDAQRVAALSVLRSRRILAEEEGWMARLARNAKEPRVREAAIKLRAARRALGQLYNVKSEQEAIEAGHRAVDAAELTLGRLSQFYVNHLQVQRVGLEDLQHTLDYGETLVEFYRYRRHDFGEGYAEERWAAVLVYGVEEVRAIDLGKVDGTSNLVNSVLHEKRDADAAAKELHRRLIEPLRLPEEDRRIYIVPDTELHFLNFYRLLDGQGRYFGERRELRVILSARDLLGSRHDRMGRGLLAVGGIEYSEDWTSLPGAHSEVESVARLYRMARPTEPVSIWSGADATEKRLTQLDQTPRVLHLATHSFYKDKTTAGQRPMLLPTIVLAEAGNPYSKGQEDGYLNALEVQGLDLEGTELVVLSGSETGRGEIGHGEGVYGLVRALRTAGARQVLMTLRPIGDASAKAFMERFYTNWLQQRQGRSDPGAALEATRAYYVEHEPDFDWTPYVLVGI